MTATKTIDVDAQNLRDASRELARLAPDWKHNLVALRRYVDYANHALAKLEARANGGAS